MRQIIVDFGVVDLTAHRQLLRLVGYALMFVGAVLAGYFGQLYARRAAGGPSLGRQAVLIVVCAVLVAVGGLAGVGFEFPVAIYLLCFAIGFAAGVNAALWRLDKAEKGAGSSGLTDPGAQERAAKKLDLLMNIAAVVILGGVFLLVADLADYTMPLRIHGYGLMLVLGFLLGMYLAQRRARLCGESPQCVMHISVLALMGGVGGARLAYVFKHWDRFSGAERPLVEVLNVTSGGLIYYGGLLAATALVVAYLWRRRLPARRYLDIMSVSLMVGLAFGRAGCTLNGCCYGAPCRADWPLGMRFAMFSKPLLKLNGRDNPYSASTEGPSPVYAHQIAAGRVHPDERLLDAEAPDSSKPRVLPPRYYDDRQIALAEAHLSEPVKPAQLLAVANALLLAALLAGFWRLRRREGQVFALLLILYPITRFALELIRDDNAHDITKGVLTHNQYTSVAIAAAGVIMMLTLRFLPASCGPVWSERQADAGKAEKTKKESN